MKKFMLFLSMFCFFCLFAQSQNCQTDSWPRSIAPNQTKTFSVSATSGATYQWAVTSKGGSASIQGSSTGTSYSSKDSRVELLWCA